MRARGKERRNIEQQTRPPFPPIDEESARQKIKAAQDAWNTRDPEKVSLAYMEDSVWRNRDEFFQGREAIKDFLTRKWARELDYRLEKNLWCFTGTAYGSGSSTRAGMRRETGGDVIPTTGLQHLPILRLQVVLDRGSSRQAHLSGVGKARDTDPRRGGGVTTRYATPVPKVRFSTTPGEE